METLNNLWKFIKSPFIKEQEEKPLIFTIEEVEELEEVLIKTEPGIGKAKVYEYLSPIKSK